MQFVRLAAALAGALVLVGAMTSDVSAQRRDRDGDRRSERGRGGDDWVLLGEKSVGFRVDRDVINIGQGEEWFRTRSFKALRFVAEGNDVHMISIRLVYLNGYGETLTIDRRIRPGEQLPVDLRGERSYLRQIEMVYRSRPDFRGQAVIKVFAEPARRGGPGPMVGPVVGGREEWVELGCQQVSLFGKDRDTIRVGRREGRFKAIRLSARGADVEMLDLKVIYANGEPDDVPVRHIIRSNDRTRPLDLRGWERSIDHIEMRYRTVPNFKGLATVCVEGRQ
jgi:hypothetical protein